jgi:hypothetical protein
MFRKWNFVLGIRGSFEIVIPSEARNLLAWEP